MAKGIEVMQILMRKQSKQNEEIQIAGRPQRCSKLQVGSSISSPTADTQMAENSERWYLLLAYL
jgi:hypothetical protein